MQALPYVKRHSGSVGIYSKPSARGGGGVGKLEISTFCGVPHFPTFHFIKVVPSTRVGMSKCLLFVLGVGRCVDVTHAGGAKVP